MNIERFSFGEGKIHTPSYTTPQPDVRNYGWTAYGLRVGIWRFFDLVDKLKLPVCHLVNSSVYDHGLEIIKRIRKSNLPKKFHMNIACEEYKKLFSL